jgi:hypothetical protein
VALSEPPPPVFEKLLLWCNGFGMRYPAARSVLVHASLSVSLPATLEPSRVLHPAQPPLELEDKIFFAAGMERPPGRAARSR